MNILLSITLKYIYSSLNMGYLSSLEELWASMIIEHSTTIQVIDQLFLNQERFPLFRAFQAQQTSYNILAEDYFWNMPELIRIEHSGHINEHYTWKQLGCSFDMSNGKYANLIHLDMPFCYASFNERFCRIDFPAWKTFVQNNQFRNDMMNVGIELCKEFKTEKMLFIPTDTWEDYPGRLNFPVLKVADLIIQFNSLNKIIIWIEENNISTFNKSDLNCFLLYEI